LIGVFASAALAAWGPVSAQTPETVLLRGQPQRLHIEGPTSGQLVVISSGDGGWIHLAPQVASFLQQRGFFVVGMTQGKTTAAKKK
jgi:Bacterial virulence protein (VirJ)